MAYYNTIKQYLAILYDFLEDFVVYCFRGGETVELMTVEQVAEYLQMNPQVVRRWLNEKRLPGIKIGKEWRIAKEDLDKYLEELKNK